MRPLPRRSDPVTLARADTSATCGVTGAASPPAVRDRRSPGPGPQQRPTPAGTNVPAGQSEKIATKVPTRGRLARLAFWYRENPRAPQDHHRKASPMSATAASPSRAASFVPSQSASASAAAAGVEKKGWGFTLLGIVRLLMGFTFLWA